MYFKALSTSEAFTQTQPKTQTQTLKKFLRCHPLLRAGKNSGLGENGNFWACLKLC